MPSANQTLNGLSEFIADSTERVATLGSPGGYLCNTGSGDAAVNFLTASGLVNVNPPSGVNNMRILHGSGILYPLPRQCSFFNFAAAAATTLQYIPRG